MKIITSHLNLGCLLKVLVLEWSLLYFIGSQGKKIIYILMCNVWETALLIFRMSVYIYAYNTVLSYIPSTVGKNTCSPVRIIIDIWWIIDPTLSRRWGCLASLKDNEGKIYSHIVQSVSSTYYTRIKESFPSSLPQNILVSLCSALYQSIIL